MMDSENEQSVADKVNICRVCGENGSYDLWEMHFRYNNQDIPLIEAFNIFSTLDNVSKLNWNMNEKEKKINFNFNSFRILVIFIYVKHVQNH